MLNRSLSMAEATAADVILSDRTESLPKVSSLMNLRPSFSVVRKCRSSRQKTMEAGYPLLPRS